MKGITHFAAGVCGMSFFGAAVRAAEQGNPLPFALAGLASMLPDTLDFRIVRYLYRADIRIVPDPLDMDLCAVADALAGAAEKAAAGDGDVGVELDPVRLTGDSWQSYAVTFEEKGRVSVAAGPVVNTGGEILAPAPILSAERRAACRFAPDYTSVMRVERLSALSLAFSRREDGAVVPLFLPWHRRWSHSLVVALVLGLYTGILLGWVAGAAVALGYSLHIMVDQLGFLGCSLFWPYSTYRYPGRRLMHSADTQWNVLVLLLACTLTFWNLYRYSDVSMSGILLPRLLLLGVAFPMLVLRWVAKRRHAAIANPRRI